MTDSINQYLESIQAMLGKVTYIKLIKTGKEAEVHLLKVAEELMALKIYKQHTKFASRLEYFDINTITDKRQKRAVKNKTTRGISMISDMWSDREYKVLEILYECEALVPKPYMNLGRAILMEYLGEGLNPAPRLIDVQLTKEEARETHGIINDHIQLFLDLGFVHGDLSAYNILWYKNKPYIIDFPQITYLDNKNAKEKLDKDIKNIEKYFLSQTNKLQFN